MENISKSIEKLVFVIISDILFCNFTSNKVFLSLIINFEEWSATSNLFIVISKSVYFSYLHSMYYWLQIDFKDFFMYTSSISAFKYDAHNVSYLELCGRDVCPKKIMFNMIWWVLLIISCQYLCTKINE